MNLVILKILLDFKFNFGMTEIMTESTQPVKIISCPKCWEDHSIYDYDEEGSFPCRCGEWITFKHEEKDFDGEAKERNYGKSAE